MVFDTIEQRRLHMIQRANFVLTYTLAALFNTSRNSGNNNSAISYDINNDKI